MRISPTLLSASCMIVFAVCPGAAQDEVPQPVACRDLPCMVMVDWTREGGENSQVPDRRYGNAVQLEARVKARLRELGYTDNGSSSPQVLQILLVPSVGRAMCDEMAGTATDMSCRAITDIQARLEGPENLREGVDLPSRIRNRCSSDRMMPVDRLGVYVADMIVYALEGKAKGERRPVARC